MRDHRPTSTETILTKSAMGELQAQVKEIQALNTTLHSLLSPNIVEHCRVANLKESVLVLEVASAAIKMKVDRDRLYLLNGLRQQGYPRLISMEVRINPDLYRAKKTSPKQSRPRSQPPISESTASYLRAIADRAPDKIKQRLENLAQLANSSNS